jgi:cytochrome c5
MKHLLLTAFLIAYLATIVTATLASETNSASAAAAKPATQTSHLQANMPKETGEDVFKNNCGRCHMPPMVVPPRITGTVIMHMRVRARLSREDEQLLLKFMAP